ncbi:MAG: UDP-N-acetylmuramoyl-L-alanine--D-glutamate ligase [Patescibacteria group bacterium]|nr:UDP-N-acetylmuramoyl-L-alanine--D-glutamate ligase [Patescibacteria group bacterium]
MDFQNLKNKKVVVMGLGLLGGGVETAKWLVKKGARVLVTDLKTKNQLKKSLNDLKGLSVKYILGRHREEDFKKADLIIKNPGVPKESKFLKIARKNKIPIETDISIFFRLFKGKIIGVTGTKGKSTTTFLIYQLFKKAGQKVFLGGNIGQSPLSYLDQNYPLAVLELSSWQLEDLAHLKRSPAVAVVTTIFQDHLDRYKNFQEYLRAKKLILKWQKKNDFVILNYDNPLVRRFATEAKSQVFYFSKKFLKNNNSVFIKNQKIFTRFQGREKKIIALKEIKNNCNLENILAAVSVGIVANLSLRAIKMAVKNFKSLANRLELIRKVEGVKYYNDTTATIPEAAINALNNFPTGRIILISGGADKKLNFKKFAQEIKKRCKKVILLPGTATPKIKKELLMVGYKLFIEAKTMKEAVGKAKKIAEKGDVVLLSPGCASFGLFQNIYDRAKKFIQAVEKI